MREFHFAISSAILLSLFSLNQAFAFGKSAPVAVPADLQAQFPMLSTDLITSPAVPKAGAIDYSVNIKFTNHGVKDIPAETLSRLVNAVEVIYSQCDGVNFHVNVVGDVQDSYTTDQDNVTGALNGRFSIGDNFEKFYSQFPNSPASDVISVDLVDFMDPLSRASAAKGEVAETYLGQALPASIIDVLYEDDRSSQYKTSPLSSLGGNTIRLGMEMMRIAELPAQANGHINETDSGGNTVTDFWGNPIPILAWTARQSSLLAHEMGHVLMESQSGDPTKFVDHYCPDLGVTCPQGYLMSGGGFTDKTYLRVPQMDTPIGYSTLPLVEKTQCETLIHHPLVHQASVHQMAVTAK